MKKLPLVLIWALAVQGFATETAPGETLPFHGEYRLASGGWVSFTRMGMIDALAKPLFIDWESGRYGPVMAAGSGPARALVTGVFLNDRKLAAPARFLRRPEKIKVFPRIPDYLLKLTQLAMNSKTPGPTSAFLYSSGVV